MDPLATIESIDDDKKSSIVLEDPGEHVTLTRPWTQRLFDKVTFVFTRWGIETNGIDPIPPAQRTDTRLYQMFFVWFSANMNVLSFGTGSSGPAFYGLSLRQSLITLLVVDLISCAVPAYFAIFGPKLGMRSMVQARYTWGYFGAMLPSALNVFSMEGFLVLDCIIGGQMLASVSDGHLNDTLGIVIIGLISLAVTFFGYRVIHWYESIAWIPNVIAFIIMLGIGGKHLVDAPASGPVSPAMVITYGTTVASSVISWCTMTPDYGVYHIPNASRFRIFAYTYLGFFIASIVSHMLGAAFAASALSDPTWETGFANGNSVGGLVEAVLSPAGNFGKFVTVLVALSIPSACAPTMYTFASSLMSISYYFAKVPRYIFAIISAAILIPVAIVGATRFYATFTDVLSIIGYWSIVHGVMVLVEHFLFRKVNFAAYNLEDWNRPRRLTPGIAAMSTFLCAFGIIIPCMNQAWYVGPIAKAGSGDIGIIVGSCVVCILYPVLRSVERMFSKETKTVA
ncbi:cytosine-purine permease [Laetiporus sulphureus 93-53]|uniref:Cytosine-purine permease n=1 Tax=Laetiporus sulphureus 93-53 TaxID=1314785 RepID=A0A165BB84_9APHY|nr:cytosine-purine permease [Laetiporus sulphureus 93-53]KZT00661.1 cytosine-purine permease [Laetiporus sulphureus 93-53]